MGRLRDRRARCGTPGVAEPPRRLRRALAGRGRRDLASRGRCRRGDQYHGGLCRCACSAARGLLPRDGPDYYGGFLRDPDGNSAETVFNGPKRDEDGLIDHLWIGVADLEAQRRFYETIGPTLGLEIVSVLADRFHVADRTRSFALVADGRPPTQHVHLAFPVPDDEAVAEFHRVATAAGYRDNGPPGERPEYHPGYVGAFVLDPDGNNVEAVNHNRDR